MVSTQEQHTNNKFELNGVGTKVELTNTPYHKEHFLLLWSLES